MINTNWGLLLGLIFGVLLVFTSLAYLITWIYWRCIERLEVAEINEKHMSLPRPATAPTIMVPETPVTGTAVQFNFSRPDRRSIERTSMYSQFTIPEHMAAGAIMSPERAHRRTRSSLMASRKHSRHMHSRGNSRDLRSRLGSRDLGHLRDQSRDRHTRYHPQYQLQRSQSQSQYRQILRHYLEHDIPVSDRASLERKENTRYLVYNKIPQFHHNGQDTHDEHDQSIMEASNAKVTSAAEKEGESGRGEGEESVRDDQSRH